jgi:hypothetical protein
VLWNRYLFGGGLGAVGAIYLQDFTSDVLQSHLVLVSSFVSHEGLEVFLLVAIGQLESSGSS